MRRALGARAASVVSSGFKSDTFQDIWNPVEDLSGDLVVYLGTVDNKKRELQKILAHFEYDDRPFTSIGTSPGTQIPCKIRTSEKSTFDYGIGFYELDQISEDLPDAWGCLILGQDEAVESILGILDYPNLLSRSGKIIVTGVEDARRHSVSLKIAEVVRGNIRVEAIRLNKDQDLVVAEIQPGGIVSLPRKLDYPSTKGILPKGMVIPSPEGLANDYSKLINLERESYGRWVPNLPISMVIPVFNRSEILAKTLHMITHQTYPLDLIEVVIADDGSSEDILSVVNPFREKLNITYTNQEDMGYRLSAARNMGIRASSNDHIIILDADVAPIPNLVEAYARRFSVTSRAVLCGHRRYVDANSVKPEDLIEDPSKMLSLPDIITQNDVFKKDGHALDWRMGMYRSTANLRFEKYPFRAVCGGNIGFHKSVFERAGGFDEEFRAWGKEDTEWGFRVWNKGDYIIPVYEACGLHQEPPGGKNETDRELGLEEVMPIFTDRVPVMYRKPEHGIKNSVPLVSIYIPAYNAESTIVDAIQSVLNQTFEDLEVCIAVDGADDGTLSKLEDSFFDNPRVRWVHQGNQGIGGASNSAVQLCRGVFIGQLDSDDVLLPEAIDLLLEQIQSDTRIGVVYGSFQKETPEGDFLEDGYDWPEYSREKLMYGCIVHHFRLFRARDWWRTEGFSTDLTNAVDYDMFLKLSSVTEMKHVQAWTYVYRIHEESTSISQKEIQIRNHHLAVKRHLKRLKIDSKWEALPESDENPRKVIFKKRKYQPPEKTALPFSKMQAAMRAAAPPVIRILAEYEATRKPWTMNEFPKEMLIDRAQMYAKRNSSQIEESEIRDLHSTHGDNLWAIFSGIDSK
jgi:chondroitin synthase